MDRPMLQWLRVSTVQCTCAFSIIKYNRISTPIRIDVYPASRIYSDIAIFVAIFWILCQSSSSSNCISETVSCIVIVYHLTTSFRPEKSGCRRLVSAHLDMKFVVGDCIHISISPYCWYRWRRWLLAEVSRAGLHTMGLVLWWFGRGQICPDMPCC